MSGDLRPEGEPSLVLLGRKRIATLTTGAVLAGVVGLVPTTPAVAEPDIDDVKARVDRLFREAEEASERLNDAKLEVADLRSDLRALRADQKQQDQRASDARARVRDAIVRSYQGDRLSAVGQVAASDDPGSLVEQLSTMSAYDTLNDELFDTYAAEAKALEIRRQATQRRVGDLEAVREQLADEKATIEDRLEDAEALLDELEEAEREEVVSRDSMTPPASVPASGRAAAAVRYALAQVGKSYVYGAAGPSAFDCSGLTMMAFRQAGISLPHSSRAQFSSGTRVSASQLQPGDLVFYYSPISHVGIYIGGGRIVDAANPGTGVRVTGLHSMPFVGAVRPG